MTLNQGTTIVKKQPELLDHDKEKYVEHTDKFIGLFWRQHVQD